MPQNKEVSTSVSEFRPLVQLLLEIMEINMFLYYNRYEESERIRNLGFVMPFSNTERMNFACPRLWTYSYVQNYNTDEKGEALSYGIIWHKLLEEILKLAQKQDRLMDEKELNEYISDNLGNIIEKYYLEMDEEILNQNNLSGRTQDFFERIENAIIGWHRSWNEFMEQFKILDVEMVVCAPVLDPLGNIAKFPIYIIEEEDYIRPARIGESLKSKLINIPFYKVGKIDVLVQDRNTGDLWICDHKTSSSPSQYENMIAYDVQLPSYASLLEHEIMEGKLQHLQGNRIAGVIYDIAHSKIKGIPELLKSGKLSKAKNSGMTSWIMEAAIEKYGLSRREYSDHITYLINNTDKKRNYQRYFHLSQEDMDRCTDEDYGIAFTMATKRRQLVEISEDSIVDFNAISYRYPICQKYGNCRFSSFCLANNQPSVIMMEQVDIIKWSTVETLKQTTDIPF